MIKWSLIDFLIDLFKCCNFTLQCLSQLLPGLVVPDDVALAVILAEVVIEQRPVGCALHMFSPLSQHNWRLVLAQPGGTRGWTKVRCK